MRVILEVVSGPGQGRKVPLRAGQRLQVGRTEFADLTLAGDGHMSSLHFALETSIDGCQVEDLGSSNGTLLNGQPVTTPASVYNGDRIRAGQSEFVVHVEGLQRQTIVVAEAGAPAALRGAAPPPGTITYSVEIGNSRFATLRGTTGQAPPHQLAALLTAEFPLYLVLDPGRIGQPPPEELSPPEYLFNWYPEESRRLFSQVILSGADPVDLFSWIEKAWGKDGLVCLFSRQDRRELLAHLRLTAGAYARPTILAPLLQLAAPEGAEALLAGVDAVLIEGAAPDEWLLIGRESLLPTVEKLGLQKAARNP
ncbi:MAG: FHA domain-containing protein [Pirellulales bacterium]|jgi:hypothetical protein|nr:FHA domain-containing protein [Thermoguttaceae bacterium]MDD4785558.1 FHA domain-containing protein [Pirellulales bacterium]NLZ00766.1 FHA domain-containing protein [Pirellulaceae bacterium]